MSFSYDYRLLMQNHIFTKEQNGSLLGPPDNEGIPNLTTPFMNPGPKAKPIKSRHVVWRKKWP